MCKVVHHLAVFGMLAFGCCLAAPVTYHVSCRNGADTNCGTANAPFQTVARAVKQARRVLSAAAAPEGVVVEIGEGRYVLSEGISLRNIRAVGGYRSLVVKGRGSVTLVGSVSLAREKFRPVQDAAVASRLSKAAAGHVMEFDLKGDAGLDLCGCVPPDVFQGSFPGGQLILDSRALKMASWPDDGWAAMGTVVGREGVVGAAETSFVYGDFVPAEHWSGAGPVWLQGFWRHDWYEENIRVASVDTASRRIALASSGSRYGIGEPSIVNRLPRRFRALNVLEELDREGEWCLDAASSRLYVWLPERAVCERIEWTWLRQPFFTLENCAGVCIQGLVMENSRGDGVVARGTGNCVRMCEFRHLDGTAVDIAGAFNEVRQNDIHDCNGAGVKIAGGSEKTLLRGDNVVEDCHIWRIGQTRLTYHGAVHVSGVGNIVRHNLIHDLPHSAVFFAGNDHLIEGNDIFAACLETGDSGALYSGRSWAGQGTRIHGNTIHDLGGFGNRIRGVYLDDCAGGADIRKNTFVAVPEAVRIGGGRYNAVDNNVFVLCGAALAMDARGAGLVHWGTGDCWDLFAKLQTVKYTEPPWSKAYPYLVNIREDSPEKPLHNRFARNVVVGGAMLEMKDVLRCLLDENRDNWLATSMDAVGFANWKKGNFQIEDNDELRRRIHGFAPVDFAAAGLLEPSRRPVKASARQEYARSLEAMDKMPELLTGK